MIVSSLNSSHQFLFSFGASLCARHQKSKNSFSHIFGIAPRNFKLKRTVNCEDSLMLLRCPLILFYELNISHEQHNRRKKKSFAWLSTIFNHKLKLQLRPNSQKDFTKKLNSGGARRRLLIIMANVPYVAPTQKLKTATNCATLKVRFERSFILLFY